MNQESVGACCAVCKLATSRRCSRCLSIYYCNKEHQRDDWQRHRSECLPKLSKHSTKRSSKTVASVGSIGDELPKKDDEKGHIPGQKVLNDQHKKEGRVDTKPNSNNIEDSDEGVRIKLTEEDLKNVKQSNNIASKQCVNNTIQKDNSVIASVVHTIENLTRGDAITYEGSSENEILSDPAQQLGSIEFSPPTSTADLVKPINRSIASKMPVMPGNIHESPRVGQKEYPEASLKGSMAPFSHSRSTYYMDSSDPYYDICQRVIRDMTQYGVCVINNFLGKDRGLLVLREVLDMYKQGIFTAGQLVSNPKSTEAQTVRSDRIAWIDGKESQCNHIRTLINHVDSIILRANKIPNNGKMGDYVINGRTKAMVACYPGSGSHYVKHVDNPNKDGRCITAIYYLNLDWDVTRSGGLLRVFPEGTDQVADIEPIFDRMLFFWSDRRNPHEVQPAFNTRYAITLWYFDAHEREEALRLYNSRGNQPSSSK